MADEPRFEGNGAASPRPPVAHLKTATEACLRTFALLCHELERQDSSSLEDLQEEFGRLKVWAGNLGALAMGHSALDWRLRDADVMRSTLLDLLEQLHQTLQSSIEIVTGSSQTGQSDTTTDNNDISDDISLPSIEGLDEDDSFVDEFASLVNSTVDLIKNLYKLSFQIRNSNTKASRAGLYKEIDPVSGLEIFGDCYASFDYNHVNELFISLRKGSNILSSDDQFLLQRLAKGNITRRRKFRYWHKHGQKLVVVEKAKALIVKTVVRPIAEREPSRAINPVEGPQTDTQAESTVCEKSIHTTTEATLFDPQFDLTRLETQSVTSVATTARDLEGRVADLPSPPKDAIDGKDFICPYCFTLCPSRHGKGRAWRTHLIQDLQPYLCTFANCTHSSRMYGSRREWADHEDVHHCQVWICRFHPLLEFPAQQSLELHLQQEHHGIMTDHQISAFASISKSTKVDAREKCPICMENVNEISNFTTHLANHLERIAMFSIPRVVDDVEDETSLTSFRAVPQSNSDVEFQDDDSADFSVASNSSSSRNHLRDMLEEQDTGFKEWLSSRPNDPQQLPLPSEKDARFWAELFKGREFEDWCANRSFGQIYCCSSDKARLTAFTSAVVQELHSKTPTDIPIISSYMLSHEPQSRQTFSIVADIFKQLAAHVSSNMLPSEIAEGFYESVTSESPPSLKWVSKGLKIMLDMFPYVYLILDNFDQDWDQVAFAVLRIITKFRPKNLGLMITTTDCTNPLSGVWCNVCKKKELYTYWHCAICNNDNFDICQSCRDQGLHCSDPSHRLVDMYEGRSILNIDPTDPNDSSSETFATRLTRITTELAQMEVSAIDTGNILRKEYEEFIGDRIIGSQYEILAMRAFDVVFHAVRPLSVLEFQNAMDAIHHGAAVSPSIITPDMSIILEATGGLVVVDQTSQVYFFHVSLYDSLRDLQDRLFPLGHRFMAMACLDVMSSQYRFGKVAEENQSFYPYACCHWGDHVRECLPDEQLERMVALYLNDTKRIEFDVERAYSIEAFGTFRGIAFQRFDVGHGLDKLHVCSIFGLDCVIKRLQVPHHLNVRDPRGQTPLMYASRIGHRSTVMTLIELGGNPNLVDNNGRTALYEAIQNARIHIVEDFIANPSVQLYTVISEDERRTALMDILQLQSIDLVRKLLDRSDLDINHRGKHDTTVLSWLSNLDAMFTTRTLRLIVGHPHFDITIVDRRGRGCLMQLREFDISLLKILLEHGADLEQRDWHGETPVYYAMCYRQDWQAAQFLVEQGADLASTDNFGDGLLYRLVHRDDTDDLRYIHLLLSRRPDLVNSRNSSGLTALHRAIIEDKLRVSEELLASGADVTIVDDFGRTAFEIARQYGRTALIAQLHLWNVYGRNELNAPLADEVSLEPVQSQTKFRGLNAEMSQLSEGDLLEGLPAWSLAYQGHFDRLWKEWNEKHIDILAPCPENGNTAFHWALKKATSQMQHDLFSRLFELGLPTILENKGGETLLGTAVLYRRSEIVKMFIQNGVDLQAKDSWGQTILDCAYLWGREDIAHELEMAGARRSSSHSTEVE